MKLTGEERRDNRDLCGDQSNQKITKAEIQEMKNQGVSGQVCLNNYELIN